MHVRTADDTSMAANLGATLSPVWHMDDTSLGYRRERNSGANINTKIIHISIYQYWQLVAKLVALMLLKSRWEQEWVSHQESLTWQLL